MDSTSLLARRIAHEICGCGTRQEIGFCRANACDWGGHSLFCNQASQIIERELIAFEAKIVSLIAEDVRQTVAREKT